MSSLTVAVLVILSFQHATSLTVQEMDSMKIYYDKSNRPVPMMTNVSEVVPNLKTPSLRFGPLPCSCNQLTCGCCVDMRIQLFNFSRHACTNFTYDPYEFSIGMNMLWNEESIYQTSVSGKNPPPICVQAPVPYLPTMDQCVRMFNIFTPGRNIHMCMNLETRIERVPVLVLQFDCMRMGADGVALLKPEAEGGLKPPGETEERPATESTQEAANIFDQVDPEKKVNQTGGEDKNITSLELPAITETTPEKSNMTELQSPISNQTSEVNLFYENNTEIETSQSSEKPLEIDFNIEIKN